MAATYTRLTPTERKKRQYEAFMMYKKGMPLKEIAVVMKVTPKTVTDWKQKGHWNKKQDEQLQKEMSNLFHYINKVVGSKNANLRSQLFKHYSEIASILKRKQLI